MPRLQQPERHRAIGMLSAGASVRHIARTFNVNQTTISRLSLRFRATGSAMNGQQSPRMRLEPLLGRCVASALLVCGQMEDIPLIEHFVTFKMTPTLLFDDLQDVY